MSSDESSSDGEAYGPALPPHLLETKPEPRAALIGPQLPPSLMRNTSKELPADSESYPTTKHINPTEEDEDSDGAEIGPYLPEDPRNYLIPVGKVPKPAAILPTKREEWMLVCPQNRPLAEAVGLGPRKFLAKTPDEPGKRRADDADEEEDEEPDFLETAREEMEQKRERERDAEMAGVFKEGGKGQESLLSLHLKKRKMEEGKKSEDGKKERRAFDRDIDLKVNGLSEKDKAKFIDKCGELGGRFKGGKRKFL